MAHDNEHDEHNEQSERSADLREKFEGFLNGWAERKLKPKFDRMVGDIETMLARLREVKATKPGMKQEAGISAEGGSFMFQAHRGSTATFSSEDRLKQVATREEADRLFADSPALRPTAR